jgi:hypothetical protein
MSCISSYQYRYVSFVNRVATAALFRAAKIRESGGSQNSNARTKTGDSDLGAELFQNPIPAWYFLCKGYYRIAKIFCSETIYD